MPIALAGLLLLAACARPPAALRGEFVPVTVADARAGDVAGERVRWGGELVRTVPQAADTTCFEVVAKPLDRRGRPSRVDDSPGRFVACARGFYDPAVWAPGREMTAVGTVGGTAVARVGEHDYRFPRIDADAVHLWPPHEPGRGPRIGGYGGWGGGPWWSLGIGIGF
jgi:outer membrane lipoprotein